MKKTKEIFYKDKWRELNVEKVGGKDIPKNSRRKPLTICYVMYKGRHRTLSDDILNSFKIRYI